MFTLVRKFKLHLLPRLLLRVTWEEIRKRTRRMFHVHVNQHNKRFADVGSMLWLIKHLKLLGPMKWSYILNRTDGRSIAQIPSCEFPQQENDQQLVDYQRSSSFYMYKAHYHYYYRQAFWFTQTGCVSRSLLWSDSSFSSGVPQISLTPPHPPPPIPPGISAATEWRLAPRARSSVVVVVTCSACWWPLSLSRTFLLDLSSDWWSSSCPVGNEFRSMWLSVCGVGASVGGW